MPEILLAIGALVLVLVVGVPVITLLVRRPAWSSTYGRLDQVTIPASIDVPPAFVPLKMTPFALRWPSETERVSTSIPEPPWPSETWDDEYFGAKARADLAKMKKAVEDIEENRRRVSLENARSLEEDYGDDGPERTTRRPPPEPTSTQPPTPRSETRPAPPGPSPEETARMVQELGLAGAVEEIRGQTGWDFRTAAQYLANNLRKG